MIFGKGTIMKGCFDFGHPQIISYIIEKALISYEKALGNQNIENKSNMSSQLNWGRAYIRTHGRSLIPMGVYQFSKDTHFIQVELEEEKVLCEFVFLLSHAKLIEEDIDPLINNAFMDGARQYISRQMLPSLYKIRFGEALNSVSPCFGPGLFSMDISQITEYYHYLNVSSDLAILKGEMLTPLSSFIGVMYGLEKPFTTSACKSCKSQTNCQFCMIHHEK